MIKTKEDILGKWNDEFSAKDWEERSLAAMEEYAAQFPVYWKLIAHEQFQEVERLKTLIVKIIPFANALCSKCLPGHYDLSVYDEIKQFQSAYKPEK